MVDAIENGDDEMARKLAQQHVKRFNQYMKKREDASASGWAGYGGWAGWAGWAG